MKNKLLERIDKKDYLTEREHREFLNTLDKELEEAKKNKRILEVLKNFSQTHKEDGVLGIMIEIWSDTEHQKEYQDIKEWVEEVHNHNEKIEEKINNV